MPASRREHPHREGHIHHQEPEVEPVTNRTEGRFGPVTAALAVVNGLLFSALVTSSCDPNNLCGEVDDLRKHLVDPSGEGSEVCVLCAEDHAAVGQAGIVKVAEVLAIVCQYGSAVRVRERQHFLVWDPQTSQVHIGYR